jgi:hypothetical protein
MIHHTPSKGVGKHATHNDVVVSVRLELDQDLAPRKITMVSPGDLFFDFHL